MKRNKVFYTFIVMLLFIYTVSYLIIFSICIKENLSYKARVQLKYKSSLILVAYWLTFYFTFKYLSQN